MVSGDSSKGLPSQRQRLVFGSRKSKLALWQTHHVAQRLVAIQPNLEIEIKEFSTAGDRQADVPLPSIGGKGLFTTELDDAINRREIDVAIHSLKDLPTQPNRHLQVMPVLAREDPRDVLVSSNGRTLAELPPGSVIGTSSYRRQSQLLALRPDLKIRSIRGNVPTRIAKVSTNDYDAVILAAAGVIRIGMRDAISQWFPLADMLPAPGQAAIAATFHDDDLELLRLLRLLADPATTRFVTLEREFLTAMGGGCSAPIAAHACFRDSDSEEIVMTGRVGSMDGTQVVTRQRSGENDDSLALQLAKTILDAGGREILQSLE